MSQDKEYYAFISYKREDEKWAKWLQDKLEHYHLPTTLNGKDLPKNLCPVFRDVDELSAGNLPEQIFHALSNSKNLIVVCSPRAAKSEWVNKEIEDFIKIKNGNTNNIFPFIIEGSPFSKDSNEECFPEALQNLPENEERLGGNINEQGGRNAAVVKIVAGMLGLGFDSLWQKYEREQRRTRNIKFATITGVVLLFAIGTFIFAKTVSDKNTQLQNASMRIQENFERIQKDSVELERRNESLILKNDSIKKQNALIEQQKDEIAIERDNVKSANYAMKVNLSRILAEKANQLTDEGDSYLARLISLQALPPYLPYTKEAETALRNACAVDEAILRGHYGEMRTTCFCANGNYIISGSNDKTIRIWNAKSGEQVGNPLIGHTLPVTSVSFSPDTKRVISSSADRTIRIWDIDKEKQLNTLVGHNSVVNSVAFSPNGEYIVSASGVSNKYSALLKQYGFDNSIRIWDFQTGKQIGEPLEGHTDRVNSASFTLDGKYIISASDDRTIRIWNAKTGKQIGEPLEGHTDRVNSASFSPDGKYIVSTSDDRTIRIWDFQTGKQIGNPLEGHTGRVNSASFSPDGKYIVSASDDRTIRIWNFGTNKQTGNPLVGHANSVRSASFSPDGKKVLSASLDNTIRIWDVSSRYIEKYQRPAQLIKDGQGYVICANGNDALYRTDENTIKKWDVIRRVFVGDSIKIQTDLTCASLSRNGQYAAFAYEDSTIETWGVNTKPRMKKKWKVHSNCVKCISISPDGRKVISVADKTVTIWDTRLGLQVGKPLLHTEDVTSASFSPDGERIISTSGGIIKIWDVKTGKLTEKLLDGNAYLFSASFSPDGNYIASVALFSMSIWDVNKKKVIGRPHVGRTFVRSLSFSPDSKYLFSSDDYFVRIWDVNTGLLVGQPIAQTASDILFSPIGEIVMLCDNSVWTYDFPPLKELMNNTSERFKKRKLTFEERQKYYIE